MAGSEPAAAGKRRSGRRGQHLRGTAPTGTTAAGTGWTDPRAALAEALLTVGSATRSAGDLANRLTAICEAMTNVLGCDRSSVFLIDGDELIPTANHGNPPDIAAGFRDVRFGVRHQLFVRVFESDRPVHIADASADPSLSSRLVEQARLTSLIVAPVSPTDGAGGVITAEFNETVADFGEFDTVVVEGLAHIASLVIDDARRRAREDSLLSEIRRRSEHDELTGLPNRRSLTDWFERARSQSDDVTPIALLVADLDRFKAVNDTFGHTSGDRLLRGVAERLVEAASDADAIVCRVGGDEFVVGARVRDVAAAERLARRMIESLAEPVPIGGSQSVSPTASIGIAMADVGELDPDVLLTDADAAMYVAKHQRRGQTVFAGVERWPVVSRRFELERSLPMALRRREITPWFQPIVNAATGQWVAVEALARWEQSDGTTLRPAEFLPTVAEMGLLRELTDCIVEQAAELLVEPILSDLTVYVNLSVRDIDDALLDRLDDRFADLPRLAVELTEADAMQQTSDVVAILSSLRDAGVRVALDDFGTGYSSMSLLGQLPLDVVKIDRTLVQGARSHRTAEVLRASSQLGRALGLTVLAEGVEDRHEIGHLAGIPIDLLQGHAFGRPMPLGELIAAIASSLGRDRSIPTSRLGLQPHDSAS